MSLENWRPQNELETVNDCYTELKEEGEAILCVQKLKLSDVFRGK
jgi:hypothetical protein